jgi:hypothetical protein
MLQILRAVHIIVTSTDLELPKKVEKQRYPKNHSAIRNFIGGTQIYDREGLQSLTHGISLCPAHDT